MRPLQALTALARRVDLADPGERMPGAEPTSEAGELALTFNEMLDRLEAERREATGRVLAAQESERLRIAQELHDQVGQELTAVLLARRDWRRGLPDELRGDVGEVQEAVRASLEDVRRIAIELRPEALDDLGLVSALAVLGERLRRALGLDGRRAHRPRSAAADGQTRAGRLPRRAGGADQRRSPLRLATAPSSTLETRATADCLLTVRDHGRGLSARQHGRGRDARDARARGADRRRR